VRNGGKRGYFFGFNESKAESERIQSYAKGCEIEGLGGKERWVEKAARPSLLHGGRLLGPTRELVAAKEGNTPLFEVFK
jgi:hypothetical protein